MQFLQHLPLKYKFWAVNSVAFISTLLLVLVAVGIEQDSIQTHRMQLGKALITQETPERPVLPGLRWVNNAALGSATGASATWYAAAELPAGLPTDLHGVWVKQDRALGIESQDYIDLLFQRAPFYALVVSVLMVLVLAVSQLLILFITRNIISLRDTMTQVQNTGDLTLRAKATSRDEVGSMATAFNAMQQAQQQVVSVQATLPT